MFVLNLQKKGLLNFFVFFIFFWTTISGRSKGKGVAADSRGRQVPASIIRVVCFHISIARSLLFCKTCQKERSNQGPLMPMRYRHAGHSYASVFVLLYQLLRQYLYFFTRKASKFFTLALPPSSPFLSLSLLLSLSLYLSPPSLLSSQTHTNTQTTPNVWCIFVFSSPLVRDSTCAHVLSKPSIPQGMDKAKQNPTRQSYEI
jgi:hypothetical protein